MVWFWHRCCSEHKIPSAYTHESAPNLILDEQGPGHVVEQVCGVPHLLSSESEEGATECAKPTYLPPEDQAGRYGFLEKRPHARFSKAQSRHYLSDPSQLPQISRPDLENTRHSISARS